MSEQKAHLERKKKQQKGGPSKTYLMLHGYVLVFLLRCNLKYPNVELESIPSTQTMTDMKNAPNNPPVLSLCYPWRAFLWSLLLSIWIYEFIYFTFVTSLPTSLCIFEQTEQAEPFQHFSEELWGGKSSSYFCRLELVLILEMIMQKSPQTELLSCAMWKK